MSAEEIYEELLKIFPDAECELVHKNPFELAVAVTLSAQTTDASVNKVTPKLFEKYPDAYALSEADIKEVEEYIRQIGLYRNKAKNIVGMAKMLVDEFDGVVPRKREELMRLPGVGRKSANVILSVCFGEPAIAVDTHVERVSKRLRLAYLKDDVLTIEKKLMKKLKKEHWCKAHHLFIFFGRYLCKAKNPECIRCPFVNQCREKNKNIPIEQHS